MASLNSEIKHYLDNVRSEKSLDGIQRAWLEGLVSASSPRSMNGLYHAYWDLLGIGGGSFNGRMRTWLHQRGYTQRSINAQLRDYWTSYPLDATTEVISSDDYDGHEISGGDWVTGWSDVCVTGNIFGTSYSSSFHYTTIPFKQGTELTSAVITPYCKLEGSTNAQFRIHCQDIDDGTIPSNSNKPSAMTLTTAYTTGQGSDGTADSAISWNITTAVNEVLARPGWKANNDLTVVFKDNSSGSGHYMSMAGHGHANFNNTNLVLTP